MQRKVHRRVLYDFPKYVLFWTKIEKRKTFQINDLSLIIPFLQDYWLVWFTQPTVISLQYNLPYFLPSSPFLIHKSAKML